MQLSSMRMRDEQQSVDSVTGMHQSHLDRTMSTLFDAKRIITTDNNKTR